VLAPRRGRLVALALPVVSLLWSLLRLYRDPAVFALDPFGGYFPGPIYDEALRPPLRLLWFRLVNLLWAGSALAAVAAWQARTAARAAVAAALAVASLVLFSLRGPLGFHVRRHDVEAALSRRTESAHFVLHTDPHTGESDADLALTRRDLEFRYDQLRGILGAEPAGRVDVFQFPSAAAKKELVGAGGTLYAKPWAREIYVQAERFPAGRLRHELAHVFASAFGDPLFGVSLRWRFPLPRLAMGLVEGLAVAADYSDPDGRATIHQESRAIVNAGRAPPLSQVVGAAMYAVSGARAYTLAGSFCHFLLQEQGPEKLRALYRSAGDFEGVYGQPLAALEQRWRAFLERQPLDEVERARAAETFRRPAIFGKVCARELAARVAEARGRMGSAEAVALLESVCHDDPGEPGFRLDLADALVAAGQRDRALDIANGAAADTGLTRPVRARAAHLIASLQFHAGRIADARRALEQARALATDDAEERLIFVKLRALEDDARSTLGRAFFGEAPGRGVDGALMLFLVSEFARQHATEALGPYLLARQLAGRDAQLTMAALAPACPDGGPSALATPLPPLFQRECTRLMAETAFRGGDRPASRAAFQRVRDEATTEADRLRAQDWLERIAWEERRAQE
jgi:tetratricopeptide (TPR) repeat protein